MTRYAVQFHAEVNAEGIDAVEAQQIAFAGLSRVVGFDLVNLECVGWRKL